MMVRRIKISFLLFLFGFLPIINYAQDIPKTTKVTISTTQAVEYSHYTKEEPPAIVIEFKSKNVFSYWEGVLNVNRGNIKEIHTEYYPTQKSQPQTVKSLTFMLVEKTPYNISQTKDAIIIEIENPPSIESAASGEILGEIEIFGKHKSETDTQREIELDKALSKIKQNLEEPKKKLLVISKGEPSRYVSPKTKTSSFFYFLFLPVLILLGGYFLWKKKRRATKLGPLDKLKPVLAMEDFKALQQELDSIRQEKSQLEVKVAEKENLEKRLINIEILEAQLQKAKKDLEEANSSKQQLEKQLEEKNIQIDSLKKDIEQNELNLRHELEIKEGLIKQLSDEKESLKIEVVKMDTQLKKEVNMREELDRNLKEKEKAMEILSAATIEKVPKEDALKEARIDEQLPEEKRKFPRLELAPLGDKGILLRLATSNKDEPYLIGVVKNVSSGGIMAELDKELLPPDSVNMDLIEHGSFSPIGVLGKLIWQEKQNDSSKFKVGISFFSISKDNQERINEYIKKVEDLSKK